MRAKSAEEQSGPGDKQHVTESTAGRLLAGGEGQSSLWAFFFACAGAEERCGKFLELPGAVLQ